jgi:protein-glutamine gamma-glutamyltransferase
MKLQSEKVTQWYSATLGMAAGAVLYAYAGFAPVIPGILIFAVVSYFSLAAVRGKEEADNPYLKLSEAIAIVGMVSFLPLILMVDFLVALVVFIGFAQLALNLQTYDYRRFYVGMVVSFIGICVGAAESKSGFYLIFFLIYTILGGMTIGYAYMARRCDGEEPRWEWSSRTRVSLVVITLAVAIYLVLPRFPAGGWFFQPGSDHFYRNKKWEMEAEKTEKTATSDLLDELRAQQRSEYRQDDSGDEERRDGTGGERSESRDTEGHEAYAYRGFQSQFNINATDEKGHRFSNHIIARMRADRSHYLRVRIFDLFDGLQWRASSDRFVKRSVDLDGVELMAPEKYADSRLESYDIYVEHTLGDSIPAAAVPVKLQFPSTVIGVDLFGQLHSPAVLRRGTAYAVISQYNLIQGRLFAELDYQPLPSYTQLPDRIDPRIAELAGATIRGTSSQLAGAIALEQHLRTQYKYDFESVLNSQGHTPISEFLFESRSGHCEYFASALAIMLRTQHIPSRLVTGFAATNQNPLTGYYDIYALDGHAWVEAFVDDRGWVILEPTAYYEGPLPEKENLSVEQINDYVERQIKRRTTLGQDEVTLEGLLSSLWQLFYVMGSAGLAYIKLFFMHSWYWLLLLSLLGTAGWFGWLEYKDLWMAYRINRKVAAYSPSQPVDGVTFYLSATAQLLQLAGFHLPPGFTIEQYLAHIRTMGAERGDDGLAAVFNRVCYNGDPGDDRSASDYKSLFQSVSALGFRNLQTIAKTQQS